MALGGDSGNVCLCRIAVSGVTGNCILRSPARVAGDVAAGACVACDKVASLRWIQLQHPDGNYCQLPC